MKDVESKMEKAVETKTPLASPFIDVTPLKEVLDRLQPTAPQPAEPTETTTVAPATPIIKGSVSALSPVFGRTDFLTFLAFGASGCG